VNVKPLFKLMVDKKASDLFFTTYSPVMIKIDGKIMPVNRRSSPKSPARRRSSSNETS
jgi:twitching motility protein PilU